MIPTSVRIFVCTERQDMRRSFDGLALAVRERLALDPESGALFVFAGKGGKRIKVLWFDHNGYCLLYKRLHRASFELPDATSGDRPLVAIDARELAATVARHVLLKTKTALRAFRDLSAFVDGHGLHLRWRGDGAG